MVQVWKRELFKEGRIVLIFTSSDLFFIQNIHVGLINKTNALLNLVNFELEVIQKLKV